MTQRPIPPPPTSGNSAGSSSTGATGGLGRSAPIRTIPTMMSGTAVAVATSRGGHPSAPSSGGVSLPTPAAVASATTASTAAPAVATAAIGGRTAYGPKKTVTDNVARATGTGTVAYATRNPVNPLPARQMQPVHHPLMTHTNLNPTASTVSKHDNDYPTDSRPAGAADPLELARNSGQSPPMAPLDLSSQRMHHQDLPQQPHIVPLPPPLLTPPSQQQQQQAHFHHPLENVGNYSQHQQQEMFSYQQQQKQSYYTQQQQTSAGSSSRQQHRNLSQTMSQTQTDSSHDYQQQQQPPDPPQLFQTSSFQKPQPRLVSKTQSKPQPEIQQRENLPQKTQSQMQNQPETNMQPPLQMQTQPAKTTSSQIPADPGYFETSNPKKSGFATAVATAARSAPPPPPTSSIAAPTNTTTAATETTVLRIKAPTTPDEELDVFLLAASTTATGAYSQQQNQHFHQLSQQQSPHTPKTRPAPLPAIENIVQKAQILAVRRAWGDVIRVTNDALIVKNVDGGGMPTHHDCYAELIAAASASASGSASSSSSTHASAQTPNVANTSGATRSSSEMARLRKETCQLIALRLISHAKLRRYVDLGKEVGQLGLIPHLPCHSSCTVSAGNVGKAPSVLGGDVVVDASSIVPPSPVEDSELVSFSAVATGHTSSTMDSLSWKEGSLHHLTSHPSSYPEKDPTPSWVPYGLRILAAQQLQYSDGGSKAVDVLYDMMDRVTRTEYWDGARAGEIKNVKTNEYGSGSMEVWKSTISNALVNTFVRKREWRMALRCLEDMLDGLEHGVEREVDWWCRGGGKNDSYDAGFDTSPSDNDEPNENSTRSNMSDAERQQMKELITSSATVELLSRQLLILLQSGAIRAAEILQIDLRYHTSKVKEWTSSFNFQSDPSSPSSMTTMFRLHRESALVRQAPLRQMLNEGLLHFARFQYSAAMNCFRDVLNQQKELRAIVSSTTANHPSGCPTWKDMTYPTLGFDAEPTLTVECLNNFSLCLLYSCNMRMAVNEMEGLIREDPALYLTEGMAFNLCTLYELGSDGEDCVRRKKILQRVAKRFFLHDVGVESFRLS